MTKDTSRAPASLRVGKFVMLLLLTAWSTGLTGCAGPLSGLGGGGGILGAGAGQGGAARNGLTGPLTAGLPGNAGAAGPGSTKVPPGGDQTQRNFCQAYLDRVNQYRAKLGVPLALFDERLFQGCLQRVPALANGMDGHAGFGASQDGASGECLAGTTNAAQAADMYYSEGPGGGHYELMFSASISRIAGATGAGASVAHCN